MIINVYDILKKQDAYKDFSGEIFAEDIEYQGEVLSFPVPLYIQGKILNNLDFLYMTVQVNGRIILNCGLCIEPYEYNLDFHFGAKLKKSMDQDEYEEDDIHFYQGYEISMKDIVIEYLLLNLPITRRCRENCRGLCHHCGINLNNAKCECEGEEDHETDHEYDNRMAALKEFFSTQGKEV